MSSRISFIREYLKNRNSVGSITPSGSELSEKISMDLSEVTPKTVLEVGCGTGSITENVFKNLGPGDKLVIVELNKKFAKITEKRLSKIVTPKSASFEVIVSNILDYKSVEKFDVVICSLPFNNFDKELISEIFEHVLGFVKPGGKLRFFEYILLRRIKIWATLGYLARLRGIEDVLTSYIHKYRSTRYPVYRNFPPAMIYDLKIDKL